MSNILHGHCMAGGFVAVHQVSLRAPGTILTVFEQTWFSRDFFSRGDPANAINKSGLEPVCATNRPAELVVHGDKSHLPHDPALSPHHFPNMHVPVLALPWQRHILVAFPLHQLCPYWATWNAPSKGQGTPEVCGLLPHACHPMIQHTRHRLLSAPATAPRSCILQCCKAHSAGCQMYT